MPINPAIAAPPINRLAIILLISNSEHVTIGIRRVTTIGYRLQPALFSAMRLDHDRR